MAATITTASRIHAAKAFIESLPQNNIYFFAGKINAWSDEDSPNVPTGLDDEQNSIESSILFVKKAQNTDVSNSMLGLRRFNWESGTVYTPWEPDVDLYFTSNWLSVNQPFYVLSIDGTNYNVYMCIDNNGGSASTSKPTGQQINSFTTTDGYIWKFMYDIKSDYVPLITNLFLPCPLNDVQKTETHLLNESNAISGTISKIRILTPGSGYVSGSSNIVISGDGTGAAASFTVDGDGHVTSITMTNPGSGYSYASVSITSPGTGATFKAILSPFKGHGSNAARELHATTALIRTSFIHNEDNYFLTKNSYRRVGLIKNIKNKAGAILTGNRYNYLQELQVQNITGIFSFSQRIIGVTSGASAVLYNVSPEGSPSASFFVLDQTKDFIIGETIYQETDPSKIAIVSSIINNDIDVLSGDVLYVDNIQYITRKAGQTESFLIYIDF